MKTLVGGGIAALLGVVGMSVFWGDFVDLITGVIPVTLLLGGGLAIYLGFDELKDTWKRGETKEEPPAQVDDVEKYKSEIDDLKKEIETLKQA